jgi:hypothetical protein
VLTPHNLPRKIKMADERIKLTRTISTESQIFLFCLMSSVCVQHEDCKITHTHTTHTLECRKEPYTHTHSSSSSCCLSRNFFFFYSISFFFFQFFLFYFFLFCAAHTHTTHNHGNGGTARPEGSLTNELLLLHSPGPPTAVCVCTRLLGSFFHFPRDRKFFPFFFFVELLPSATAATRGSDAPPTTPSSGEFYTRSSPPPQITPSFFVNRTTRTHLNKTTIKMEKYVKENPNSPAPKSRRK